MADETFKCRHCHAKIEFDGGVGEGWPQWIGVGMTGTYHCGQEDWEGWFEGRVKAHEPDEEAAAEAA